MFTNLPAQQSTLYFSSCNIRMQNLILGKEFHGLSASLPVDHIYQPFKSLFISLPAYVNSVVCLSVQYKAKWSVITILKTQDLVGLPKDTQTQITADKSVINIQHHLPLICLVYLWERPKALLQELPVGCWLVGRLGLLGKPHIPVSIPHCRCFLMLLLLVIQHTHTAPRACRPTWFFFRNIWQH